MEIDQPLLDATLGRGVPGWSQSEGMRFAGDRAPASLGSFSAEAAAAGSRVPFWGQTLGLGMVSDAGGVKRLRLTGNVTASMPSSARDDGRASKRMRYDYEEMAFGGGSGRGHVESFESAIRRAGGYELADEVRTGMPRMNINDISTPGFYTNGSTPDSEIILKKLPYYQTPGENDVLIMRKRLAHEEETFEDKAFQMGHTNTTERTGYTIPGINRYLALTHKSIRSLDEMRHFSPEERRGVIALDAMEGRWESADDIMRFFFMAGVVNSEVFASGESSGDRTATGNDPVLTEGSAKKVNIVMQGRAFVHNLWGGNLHTGTVLWFIIKRVGRKTEQPQYVVDTVRRLSRVESMTFDMEGLPSGEEDDKRTRGTNKNPWQIIPWASPANKTPADADLAYYDDFGNIRYGRAIPWAVVNKMDLGSSSENQERIPFDLAAIRGRSTIDVIVFGTR